jgi:hypothetical protein
VSLAAGLSYEEIRRIVGEFTYKPGWRLIVTSDDVWSRFLVLRLEAEVDDARRPGQKTTIVHQLSFQAMFSEEHVEGFVMAAVQTAEAHETNEWLRRNGRLVDDPHVPFEERLTTRLLDRHPVALGGMEREDTFDRSSPLDLGQSPAVVGLRCRKCGVVVDVEVPPDNTEIMVRCDACGDERRVFFGDRPPGV